ncbi:FAD-dependent monooxygenase [Alsobacter sp. SYSU M60028]|uniref:FAD-dependent monooxygenase n=1 Tax=Alsobacter ponti TaxID=2962936 RepID=A0ABT1LFR1_9HYPH|nr:FAD-dependent monooxygenase [Alsobacter ponti]MCP8940334.1 FAD-dependent monooxygenase [Alsobacter ponti]
MSAHDHSQSGRPPILIAGAGIGGLTAALALARAGQSVTLLEKRTRLTEVGAGLQLSPNASRVLIGLGLGPALARAACEPDRIVVRRGGDAATLAEMPLGRMRERFGAPYYVIHRADLQTILFDAVRGTSGIRLAFGREVALAETVEAGVRVTSQTAGGPETLTGNCLIGADGLWSRVARAMGDDSEPDFIGYVAWRGTMPIEAAPVAFRGTQTGLWLGRGCHVVHYRVSGGRQLNVVAVLHDANSEPGWSREGDAAAFRARVGPWAAPALRELIEAVPEWQVWSLFDRRPRKRWIKGRVALLGDAAHPVLPFLAQGGACAIEDAAVLADLVAENPSDPAAALPAYELLRRPRASALQAAARKNGRIYHMAGPMALARDFVMRRKGGEALMRGYDWVYSWTAGDGRG